MGAEAQMMLAVGEPLITLTDQAVSEDTPGAAALAQYSVNASGAVQETTIGGGTATLESWITPALGMSNYEVRATLNSGTLDSGTTATWLNCGTTRSWSCQRLSIGSQSANLTIEIRNATTLLVKDSCTVTLSAIWS